MQDTEESWWNYFSVWELCVRFFGLEEDADLRFEEAGSTIGSLRTIKKIRDENLAVRCVRE